MKTNETDPNNHTCDFCQKNFREWPELVLIDREQIFCSQACRHDFWNSNLKRKIQPVAWG